MTLVALFALATQLAVTSGHIHLEHADATIQVAHSGGAADPGDRSPVHPSDEPCALCIAAGILASAQLPPPPFVPVPSSFAISAPPVATVTFVAPAPLLAFRSRAPPIA